MSAAPNQLSFLPDDYLARKAQRRSNAICAGLFLIVMTGLGSAFYATERKDRQVNSEYADVEKQFTAAASRIVQVQQMQEKQKRMAYQTELTSSLLEKVPRSYLVAEIINALPAGVSLFDLSLDSKVKTVVQQEKTQNAFEQKRSAKKGQKVVEEPKAKPKPLEVTMRVTGIAESDVQVAQLINKLSRCRVLKDVNLIISDEYNAVADNKLSAGPKMRKFVVELALDPSANIQQDEPRTASAALELKPE